MNRKEKITSYQLLLLTMFFTVGSSILELPSSMVTIAKQDAWIAVLLGMVISAIVVGIYLLLIRLYPDKNLNQINHLVFGKKAGKVISLVFTINTFFLAPPTVIFYLGRFLTIEILVETPREAIHILFGLLAIFAVRLGIEVIARVAEILFLVFITLIIGVFLTTLPLIEIERIQPVLESDFNSILWAAIFYAQFSCFPIIVMLNNFQGRVVQREKAPKAFFLGNLLGGFILFLPTIISVLVLGQLTSQFFFPSYVIAQKINIGNFIQRIEAIVTIIWFISLYFKLVLYFHSAVTGMAEIFNIKNDRILSFPLGVLIIYFSLTNFPNDIYQLEQDKTTWIPHSVIIGLLYPLLILIIGFVQKKIAGNKAKINSHSVG